MKKKLATLLVAIVIAVSICYFPIINYLESIGVIHTLNLYEQESQDKPIEYQNSEIEDEDDDGDIIPKGNNASSNNKQTNSNNNSKDNNVKPNTNSNSTNNNPKKENTLQTKTFTITFISNGSTLSEISKSCTTNTDRCNITLPSIMSNKTVLGFDESPSSVHAQYAQNQNITIDKNMTLYAITKKTVILTLYGNGAYEGSKELQCNYYNTDTNCTITLPDFNHDYYTSVGYHINDSEAIITYPVNHLLTLSDSKALYVVRMIDTNPYDKYQKESLEVWKRINNLRNDLGLSSLNYSKSLELSAMLRTSEIMQNYDFEINGNYHMRISNHQSFFTVNTMATRENYHSIYQKLDAEEFHDAFVNSSAHYNNMTARDIKKVGIAIGFDGIWYYIVELFGN